MTEVQIAGDPLCRNVNHDHVAAVSAGLTDARVAIDWHVGKLAVRRSGDFMAGDALFRDGGDLAASFGVNNPQRVRAFVSNKQN